MTVLSRLVLWAMLAAGSLAPASLLQTIDKSLPISAGGMAIRGPIASICTDGAAWLYWSQAGANTGIFCRLVDRRGHGLLRPMRIVAPRGPRDAMTELNPYPFFSCATPDGGFVVFLHDFYPDPRPTDTGLAGLITTSDRKGKRRTRVIYVSRSGRIGSALLDFPVGGSSWIKVAFGSDGTAHCFTDDIQRNVRYSRLTLRDGHLSVLDTVRLDLPVPGIRRFAGWVQDDNMRVAVRTLGRDTLLVAYAHPARSYDPSLGEAPPGGTTTFCRLEVPDLTLIDSVTVTDSTLAGVTSLGRYPRHAALVQSKRGWLFYLPFPDGVHSYVLDVSGKPVLGARSQTPVRSPQAFGTTGAQFVEFANRGYGPPWSVEWFGLDAAGNSYYDALRTESIPGKIR